MTEDMIEDKDQFCPPPCEKCPKYLPKEEVCLDCWECELLTVAEKNEEWDFSLLVNNFEKFWGPEVNMEIYRFKIIGEIEIEGQKTMPTEIVIQPSFKRIRGDKALFVSMKVPNFESEDQEQV
jgi:hypothetical protein